MHTPMTPLPPAPPAERCRVVELRQYTLHAGQRDTLVTLFDREFLETQEAVGMRVIGQFRDLGDPDRFVWLRGFADMASRAAALQAFYGGPVWAAHRNAANATMVDSDDVLLLQPAWDGAALATSGRRAAQGATEPAPGALLAMVFPLASAASPELIGHCRERLVPELRAAGAVQQGWYVTEPSANNFPRLPVREGENVLACFALFRSEQEASGWLEGDRWRSAQAGLSRWQAEAPQRLRLSPTARSALHA